MSNEPLKIMAELGDKAKYLASLIDEHYEYAIAHPEIITKVYESAEYFAKYTLQLTGSDLNEYIETAMDRQLYNTINAKLIG